MPEIIMKILTHGYKVEVNIMKDMNI